MGSYDINPFSLASKKVSKMARNSMLEPIFLISSSSCDFHETNHYVFFSLFHVILYSSR